MSADAEVATTLVNQALPMGPEERAAFLAQACAGDEELRERVQVMVNDRLAQPDLPARETIQITANLFTEAVESPTEKPGSQIGRYKLRQLLGEGGMGTVWMADQTEPVRRRVALKVIKLGMDTKEVIARFEAERQALALMDHPNIARVLDVGATAGGRPYFVMELVHGVPITAYCDEHKLGLPDRLRLFRTVCEAIQHAHQKGIIHRDLKPGNVLVSEQEGKPQAKVIDFGLAKALGSQLTEKTLCTMLGSVMGTPRYMSPEQASGSTSDVDTRSDIYCLGVMLYELLTGTTPLTQESLREAAFHEVLRRIREEEPARPSTRLQQSGEKLTTISATRKTEPGPLTQSVRGDLDWIVMKALEKQRNRRYETANALAADILRHLNNEPVVARPPTAAYRFRKFVRRNRAALGAATVMAVLAAGLLGTAFQLARKLRAGKLGGIAVHSQPQGAEVWRDGRRIGVTPFELSGIPIGPFTYSLILSNYEAVTNTISMASGWKSAHYDTLVPLAGTGRATNRGTKVTDVALTAPLAAIVTVEGKVEVRRRGGLEWTRVAANLAVFIGDSLRTDRRSRATLRFSDNSMLRVGEQTSMEIQASASFRTPVASGAIRGD